jgi:DNA-binding PadR family transcriptional regulator
MHGYQIIQVISDRSSGMWKPSPGSVYPALQLLEDQGLVRFETDEGRRVVHLTDEGARYVEENRSDLEKFWQPFSGSHTDDVVDMRSAMMHVGMAAMQVYRAGSAAQMDRAREILAATTRELYAVLAEADAGEPEEQVDKGEGDDGPAAAK